MIKLVNIMFSKTTLIILLSCFINYIGNSQTCSQSSLLIRSGWDYTNNIYFLNGSADPYWMVVQDDDITTNEPRPANIDYNGGGAGQINTGFYTAGVNNKLCDSYTTSCLPYSNLPCNSTFAYNNGTPPANAPDAPRVFNYTFCINSGTNLNSLNLAYKIHADDYAKVCLNGNYIGNNQASNCYPNICNINNFFQIGINVISVSLYNLGGSVTYMNFDGTLTTSIPNTTPFQNPNCCSPNRIITGQKFLDANGNGIKDSNEGIIPNWPIVLKNSSGVTIASTLTDLYGNYFFMNLAANTYIVSETIQPGFNQTAPVFPGTYNVNLTSTSVASNINFGNAPQPPCNNANFTFQNNQPCQSPVSFAAIACPNSGATYSWNFGDGNTATGLNVTHSYATSGNYVVTLITSSPGQVSPPTVTHNITITACTCVNPNFTFVNNGTCQAPIAFNAVVCPFPNATYTWNFGDGSPTGSGVNITHTYATAGNYNVTLSTISQGQTTPATITQVVTILPCICSNANFTFQSAICLGPVSFSAAPCIFAGATYNWNFGNGAAGTGTLGSTTYNNPGTYNVSLSVSSSNQTTPVVLTQQITVAACQPPQPCTNCIGSFAPDAGTYMVNLWVREDINPQPPTYTNARIQISFTGNPLVYTFGTNPAKNKVIEGWQRIEQKFTIPTGATFVNLKLINISGTTDAFFDDIRIFPVDGQMKTYVYDPLTMRLSAVLDENNYATFYEYDEEGKLIRVKKETEKGIMTIQENREGLKKQ